MSLFQCPFIRRGQAVRWLVGESKAWTIWWISPPSTRCWKAVWVADIGGVKKKNKENWKQSTRRRDVLLVLLPHIWRPPNHLQQQIYSSWLFGRQSVGTTRLAWSFVLTTMDHVVSLYCRCFWTEKNNQPSISIIIPSWYVSSVSNVLVLHHPSRRSIVVWYRYHFVRLVDSSVVEMPFDWYTNNATLARIVGVAWRCNTERIEDGRYQRFLWSHSKWENILPGRPK